MNERDRVTQSDRTGVTGGEAAATAAPRDEHPFSHDFPVDSVSGEPIEPVLEDPASPLRDSGELYELPDGSRPIPLAPEDRSPLELRDPAQEPERDEKSAQADPPTGNLVPPETPEQR